MSTNDPSPFKDTLRDHLGDVKYAFERKRASKLGDQARERSTSSQCQKACDSLFRNLFQDWGGSSLFPPSASTQGSQAEDGFSFKVTRTGDLIVEGDPLQTLSQSFATQIHTLMSGVASTMREACEASCNDPEVGPKMFPPRITKCLAEAKSADDVHRCMPEVEEVVKFAEIEQRISELEHMIDDL
ncbi:hypothetical protein HK104_004557 [Borealophlyctis nickersoniae]|nr:hypothetical protein HK104_004557 [Borealophlyctis nickersoniae]